MTPRARIPAETMRRVAAVVRRDARAFMAEGRVAVASDALRYARQLEARARRRS